MVSNNFLWSTVLDTMVNKKKVFPSSIDTRAWYVVIAQSCQNLWPHGLQHDRLPVYFIISWTLLKLRFIALVTSSNHLILCHPLQPLPSILPNIRVFSNKLTLHIRWSKYWSFSFSTSPSNDYSGLFSFRIDWFDLLAVQETLKCLLQHHSSKSSVFFSNQPSLWSNSHIHIWLLEKLYLWIYRHLLPN